MAEYIERGAATNAATNAIWLGKRSMSDVADAINNVETADVAPVIRGTWQLLRHDKFSDVFQCSECGRKVSMTKGKDVVEKFPYCNCGAKMHLGTDT